MSQGQYSVGEVRKSLKRFLFGKTASSAIGIALLLLLVRTLPPVEYAAYIVLLASMELTQLGSNFGSYIAASRYIPEARISNDLSKVLTVTTALIAIRICTLVAACAAFFFTLPLINQSIGLFGFANEAQIFVLVIFFEGLARYIDLVFDSVLQQKWSQLCILFRNGVRLLLLAALLYVHHSLSLAEWVIAEAIAAGAGCLLSLFATYKTFYTSAGRPALDLDSLPDFLRRYARFSVPYYLGTLISLSHNGDTARIILARLAEPIAVASFGFTGAFAATIRRYTPIFLFQGMLRPLFVAASVRGTSTIDLSHRADMVVRLCIFFLLPIGLFFHVAGRIASNALTGGRYPDITALILIFIALVAAYCTRSVTEMLASCFEGGRAILVSSFVAVLVASSFLTSAYFLNNSIGAKTMAWALLASELGFIISSNFILKQRCGASVKPAITSYFKMILITAFSAGLTMAISKLGSIFSDATIPIQLFLIGALVVTTFLAVSTFIKPFTDRDRALINGALGKNIFPW